MLFRDERIVKLGELYHTKKVTPATIEFVDIAGLVKDASKGEGLGNQFLANIREVDAIVMLSAVSKMTTLFMLTVLLILPETLRRLTWN